MVAPLRTIRLGQTHRRTGIRRRFIIKQIDHGPPMPAHEPAAAGARRENEPSCSWHYKVRTGDNGVWSAFRPLDAPADATDEEVRAAAKRHVAGRMGESERGTPPTP
jgi:hypothetical protein